MAGCHRPELGNADRATSAWLDQTSVIRWSIESAHLYISDSFQGAVYRIDGVARCAPASSSRRDIQTAGLELEMKGARVERFPEDEEPKEGLSEEDMAEFGTHQKIVDAGSWWLEIDSCNPEIVTAPTASQSDLFSGLASGVKLLQDLQKCGEAYHRWTNAEEDSSEKEDASNDYHRFKGTLPDNALIRETPDHQYIAKPQITFSIQTAKLGSFVSALHGSNMNTPGLQRNTTVVNHAESGQSSNKYSFSAITHWPRMNGDVRARAAPSHPLWTTDQGKVCLDLVATATPGAGGLALMSFLQFLFAAKQQAQEDTMQYYKARYSVMPRVPLSALYDELPEIDKVQYAKIMESWLTAIEQFNAGKDQKEAYPDSIQDASKTSKITIAAAVRSVYTTGDRRDKTITHENGEEETRKVDLISSDDIASTVNVGASVGALLLPKGSSGVFELRGMPYINISNFEDVKKLYLDTINSYGGMA
ncbi:hypothetical protein PV762_01675 [Mitsuaria sp. CC2]|uniref:hypothetical protein n=1 Tax=Mitsuaria sp. CC2 TaxID=3029186 RepID=UPI003B8B1FFF